MKKRKNGEYQHHGVFLFLILLVILAVTGLLGPVVELVVGLAVGVVGLIVWLIGGIIGLVFGILGAILGLLPLLLAGVLVFWIIKALTRSNRNQDDDIDYV